MAENVQWIRLKVGMFDGSSFKKIKRAKIGGVSYRDKLTALWFELLDLAGKSNANGFLIDNNEIPYHSYEDIAIMLDRDEKEVELCMQFFINEKMIEIIDDVYCLSNFMKYQNQDGLERIREQRRIAQAKWRERKKLGLIGSNVEDLTSTVDSTSILPSISTSISTSTNIDNTLNFEKKNKDIKHRYGEYKHVLLTDEQYNKLKEEFPNDYEKRIKNLDEAIEIHHYKYSNFYLVIKKWAGKEGNLSGNIKTKDSFSKYIDELAAEELKNKEVIICN